MSATTGTDEEIKTGTRVYFDGRWFTVIENLGNGDLEIFIRWRMKSGGPMEQVTRTVNVERDGVTTTYVEPRNRSPVPYGLPRGARRNKVRAGY